MVQAGKQVIGGLHDSKDCHVVKRKPISVSHSL
jgi:hypothetical protein